MNVELWWAGYREFAGSLARKNNVACRGTRCFAARSRGRERNRAARQHREPAPLTRDYLRCRPHVRGWFWREAGRRIAVPRRSRPPAGPQVRRGGWRRRLPVAKLTAGNTVVRGMLAQLSSAGAAAVWPTWLDAFPRRSRWATVTTREHDTALTRVSRGAARASPRRRRCVAP